MSAARSARAQGVAALVSGALFGGGLALAGMTRPEKVLGFLSFFRRWDPSLAFVMGGAIAVHSVVWRIVKNRPSPLLGGRFALPTRRDLDARLLAGAAIFGVGWGLGGLCPGPGIASLPAGGVGAAVFVVTMLAGNVLASRLDAALARSASQEPLASTAR